MTDMKKAPTDGRGETLNSDSTNDDDAIRKVFDAFRGSLAQIGVIILQEGQEAEYRECGRTLEYRLYGGTEYGSYFDVTDLRIADVPTFNGLLEVIGYDHE